MTILQDSVRILAQHPTGDYIVGIPVGLIFLWATKIMYNTTIELAKLKAAVYGDEGNPGIIQDTKRAHTRLHRHSSILQALVAHAKIDIPEKID
jgi:hypothetical protein